MLQAAGKPSPWWILSLCGLLLMFLAFSIQKIWMADFWWQLWTGRWVWEHRAVPQIDMLSYTAAGHEWIEVRWLFYLLSYGCWQLGGATAVIIGQTLTIAATLLIIVWPFRKESLTIPGLIILALCINAAGIRFIARPEIFSFLFLACYVSILQFTSRRSTWLAVWLLPLLQIVWTNSHTTFVLGPVTAWIFLGGHVAQRVSKHLIHWPMDSPTDPIDSRGLTGRLALIAVLCTLACWVNPYGHRGAMLPLLLWSEMHKGSVIGQTITELRSPLSMSGWTWYIKAAAALAAVTAITFIRAWRNLDFARVGVWGAFLYLGATAERNLALLAFVSVWAALANLRTEPLTWPESLHRFSRPMRALAHLCLGIALGWMAWYVATDRLAQRYSPTQEFGLGIVEWDVPRQAIDFIRDNNIQGRIYQSIVDGCYIIWDAPELLPVHIDGRLEVYGEEFLREFVTLQYQPQNWQAYADKYSIDTAIVQTDLTPMLAYSLARNPRWALVHLDHRNMVFIRDIPRNVDLIDRYRINPVQAWIARAKEPNEITGGWHRWIGTMDKPWHTYGMVRALMLIGSPENARMVAQRGVEKFPGHFHLRLMVSVLDRWRGDADRADSLERQLPWTAAEARTMDPMLAVLMGTLPLAGDDLIAAERQIVASPKDALAAIQLAEAYGAHGDITRAEEMARLAAESAPRSVDAQLRWLEAAKRIGRPELIIKACRAALAVQQNLHRVHFELGQALESTGDRAGALNAYRAALLIAPKHSAALNAQMRLQLAH